MSALAVVALILALVFWSGFQAGRHREQRDRWRRFQYLELERGQAVIVHPVATEDAIATSCAVRVVNGEKGA